MIRVIVRRLLISIALILVVTFVTFVLQSLLPGDAARAMLGVAGTAEQYDRLRQQLHLNEPLLVQYWLYLSAILHGDLGSSIFTQEPIAHSLAARLPVSLSLVIGTT